MGYGISLRKEGERVRVPGHHLGSNIVMDPEGDDEASCTITYNYLEVTKLIEFSFKDLDGLTGADSIPLLERVVEKLGTKRFGKAKWPWGSNLPFPKYPEDYDFEEYYWCPTPGNAGYAANQLLEWARLHPDARWEVD